MKKKILAIVMSIVLVCGVVCAFAACGNEPAKNDETTEAPAAASDLAYIKEKGKMVIGITIYEPMNYYADEAKTEYTGFDTEFAEAVSFLPPILPAIVAIFLLRNLSLFRRILRHQKC